MPTIPETCPSCFRRVQADAVFCSHCGSQIRREGRESVSENGRVHLDRLLRHHGPLPIPHVGSILRQVGHALTSLHDDPAGRVHGNLRPEVIQVGEDGAVVLADPGAATGERWGGAELNTGLVLENPEYMSPEEFRGLEPTALSDQYSLGAVAYAMLAGRPPFVGAFYRVLVAHLSEGFEPVLRARPDCPPGLASAVERMLCKDPEDRWSDVAEALQAALSGQGGPGNVELVPLDPLPTTPAPPPAPPERDPDPGEPNGSMDTPGEESPPWPPDPGAETLSPPHPSTDDLDRGPDLGPPPELPRGIEQEPEDFEDEDEDEAIGQDRAALFFAPIPPPPDPGPDDPLVEEANIGRLPSDEPVTEGMGTALVEVTAAPPPMAPPPPPRIPPPVRKARPRRSRGSMILLLLLVAAGAGWGAWELLEATGRFEDTQVAGGPEPAGPQAGIAADSDDDGGLLSPLPGRGPPTPGAGAEPDPTDPTDPTGGSSRPEPVGDPRLEAERTPDPPLPDPSVNSDPPPADPVPAQPAPPVAGGPPPTEPAPAALGALEMNIRPWAHLLVNGTPRGRFQSSVQLELPAGTHFVRMTNPNFPPFDTTVVVLGGQTTVLNKILQPDPE